MKDEDIVGKTLYDLTEAQIDELTLKQSIQLAENLIRDERGVIVLDRDWHRTLSAKRPRKPVASAMRADIDKGMNK